MKYLTLLTFISLAFSPVTIKAEQTLNTSPYAQWQQGPSIDPDFFPIAVWLQNPDNAGKYKAAGFNTYAALWKGPTESQLTKLKKAGMKVICHQNEVGRKHINDPTIIGWMHGDEPDNAVKLKNGKGYGPPVPTKKIIEDYQKLIATDPSRPILLNLGQGVAWDNWHGRGVRTNHPEDYVEYLKGCDIASFDIYPVVHSSPEVAGKLWYVAKGVERLSKWTQGEKIVWNCIECTHINNPKTRATPHQVRSEVWMSLIHGSTGLIYFVHQFKPGFMESALLSDKKMLPAVMNINRRIRSLAPILNSPTLENLVSVKTDSKKTPVAIMSKRHRGWIYIFSAGMRDGSTKAKFTIDNCQVDGEIEVLGEDRTIKIENGTFIDSFNPWDVHLYRIKENSR